MRTKKIVLFLFLVGGCLAMSSIHLNQPSEKLFRTFQLLEAEGQEAKAEVGYRYLALKLPYTAAGLRSAQKVLHNGESPVKLAWQSVQGAAQRTTVAEWLILVTAFLVTTVFLTSNILPSIVLVPFVASGAGLFHLSHPMMDSKNAAVVSFLAVNPYIYVALSLLILAGYARKRWLLSGQNALQNADSKGALSLAEIHQVKEMNVLKLQAVHQKIEARRENFTSPTGRHFMREVDRLLKEWTREQEEKHSELHESLELLQEEIDSAADAIANAQEEIRENQQLLKGKVINRKEFKLKKQQEETTIASMQLKTKETKARVEQMRQIRRRSMLPFGRWDVFGRSLDEASHEPAITVQDEVVEGLERLPAVAREEAKSRELLRRKSARLAEKLTNLDATRGRVSEKKYDNKFTALSGEKVGIDQELSGIEKQIETNAKQVRKQIEMLDQAIAAYEEELNDMKQFREIRGCFPSRVNDRLRELPERLKVSKANKAVLQQVERIYASGT